VNRNRSLEKRFSKTQSDETFGSGSLLDGLQFVEGARKQFGELIE
jgi:hypothetical protein